MNAHQARKLSQENLIFVIESEYKTIQLLIEEKARSGKSSLTTYLLNHLVAQKLRDAGYAVRNNYDYRGGHDDYTTVSW